MEPMYQWLPRRIEAQVKLCVFALVIERLAELQCKQPLSESSRAPGTLQVSQFQTPGHQFFQRNVASPELKKTLKSSEIPMLRPLLRPLLNVSSAASKT
jgi:hypothetical protein